MIMCSKERLNRAGPQDPSRLVDLCRQTIVYPSPEGIAACLRAIAADPSVAPARVKNRLDPGDFRGQGNRCHIQRALLLAGCAAGRACFMQLT